MCTKEYINFETIILDAYKYVTETGNKISVSLIDSKKYGKRRRVRIYNKDICFEIDISYITISSYKKMYDSIKNKRINIEQLINKQLLLFL